MKKPILTVFVVFFSLTLGKLSFGQTPVPTITPGLCEVSTGSLNYDGLDDYVEVPDSLDLNLSSAITIEGWFKPGSVEHSRIMGKHSPHTGYAFSIDPDAFSFGIGNGFTDRNTFSITIPVTGEWFHLAGTFDGSVMKLYINGSFESFTDFSSSIGVTVNPFTLGNYYTWYSLPADQYFKGLIDDVSIYNMALSPAQIESIYQDKNHPTSGLVAHWQFNEGSGGTVTDSAGDNDGTIHGPAWSSDHRPNAPCATPTPGSSQCPEDMVAYWRADGDAADYVADHNGTLMGGATFAAGHCEQAFSFDGDGDYVSIPSSSDFGFGSNSFSMCAWIKGSHPAQGEAWTIFDRNGLYSGDIQYAQFNIHIIPGGYFRVQIRDDYNGYSQYVSGSTDVGDEQWHFVLGVVDRSVNTIYLYVDGALDNSGALTETGPMTFNNDDETIGALCNPTCQDVYFYEGLIDEVAVYRKALTAQEAWNLYQSSCHYCQVVVTPTPPPLPIIDSGDYNGDGISDIAIFRACSGLWAVRDLGSVYFGTSGDIPASGDYNGDGTAEIAVFRPAAGLWAIRHFSRIYFGKPEDISVPADYDGDGICDVGLFRPSIGLWALRGISRIYYGRGEDRPLPGDYDGDGSAEVAIFRPATGLWSIYGYTRYYFGASGDVPVPGHYNYFSAGDDIAIFRPSTGQWIINKYLNCYFGRSGDFPSPADFDGDSLDDIAIFRPSTGLWLIRDKTQFYYGNSDDIPVTR